MLSCGERLGMLYSLRRCFCGLVTLSALVLAFGPGCQKSEPPGPPTGLSPAPFPAQPAIASPPTPVASGAAVQETPSAAPGQKMTAREVLGAMVAAYKNAASYADQGHVVLSGQREGQPLEERSDCAVFFARPNKIRLQVDSGEVVCDGQYLWGSTKVMPNQVLRQPAPPKLAIANLYPDHILGYSMIEGPNQVFSWVPVQAILLLADDPLKTLLHQAKDPVLLPPARLEGASCHRVEIERPDGKAVFWIDQNGFVLRRLEFPTQSFQAAAAADRVEGLSLVAEYTGAQLNAPVDLQYAVPQGAEIVDHMFPPGLRLMGKPLPKFEFAAMDGKPVTSESLAGKMLVIDFWATWCMPCRELMPELAQVYQRYKTNDKVVFLPVSIDESKVEEKAIHDVLADWKINDLPVYRDRDAKAFQPLGIPAVPATVLVDSKGVVQEISGGGQPGYGAELAAKIEAILAGRDLYPQVFAAFEQEKKQFATIRDTSAKNDLYVLSPLTQQEISRAEILPRSEPRTFKMTRLWQQTQLKMPGNILVVEQPGGAPRILVVNSLSSVAELGTDGKVLNNHTLTTQPRDPVLFLRTDVGADGRRYFVGSALGAQHVYLLDDQLGVVLSYPKDAADAPHAGIGDARIADFNGDGKLEIAVGYLDVVGVQGVSLEGQRLWANKSVMNVFRLAVLEPGPDKKRNLMSTSVQPDRGPLVIIDGQGKRLEEITVKNRTIVVLAAGDLDGDGKLEFCGLSPSEGGNVTAVGFNRQGMEQWSYLMPRGMPQQQIEPIISGDLLRKGSGQWILAGVDGTIQILGIDGKLIDKFAYGAELSGIALTQWGGKPVLLVATTQGVDAWQVE